MLEQFSAKPCLLHLIVFPFFDCFAVLLYTKPQTLVTVRASSVHGTGKKKKNIRHEGQGQVDEETVVGEGIGLLRSVE